MGEPSTKIATLPSSILETKISGFSVLPTRLNIEGLQSERYLAR